MENQILTTAKSLVDKLHGVAPSPILLGAWLAENLELTLEELDSAKGELIEVLDLTEEHDEDREWALFLSVYVAVNQVEREVDELLNTQGKKQDVKSPTVH